MLGYPPSFNSACSARLPRRAALARIAALAAMVLSGPTPPLAQQRDPLGDLVAEALRNNLGLATERFAEARSAAQVKEARGLFFPSATIESRYTRQSGTLNLGDLINPAYAALNRIQGADRFPTNIDLTLPLPPASRA